MTAAQLEQLRRIAARVLTRLSTGEEPSSLEHPHPEAGHHAA